MYDGAIQTCAGRAGCVRQASIAAEQEERRVARQRCACRRKWESLRRLRASHKAQERAAPRARVSRAERFLAAQDRTGPHREYARGAALERRTHDAALRNARGAECKKKR